MSEIIFPICYAALFVIAYVFVKSVPAKSGGTAAAPLIRIAIVAVGPIVWNAAVLIVMFLISIFMGPMLGSCCVKFGAVMATIAHTLAMIGMVAFFEFLVRLFCIKVSVSELTYPTTVVP